MPSSPATADFLTKLLAIEAAWAALDAGPDREGIDAAVALGGHGTQLLIRAAAMLDALGDAEAAREVLERGLALDGPTAPLQLALARQLQAMGDLDGAARWLRGAMLRARPDARLLAGLAAIELEAGRPGCAEAIVAAARDFRTDDGPGLAEEGRRLQALGRPDLAVTPFVLAFARGYRDPAFVADFGALLALDGLPEVDAQVQLGAGAMAAHLRLSAAYRGDPFVAAAREREQSEQWVGPDALAGELGRAIASRRPYSWIRLGDGEARMLVWLHRDLRASLSDGEADFIGRHIWRNWFGQDLLAVDRARLAALSGQLDAAIGNADLLGLTSPFRFDAEREHFGSLVALEHHAARIAPLGRRRPSEAGANTILNERDPFFASLLTGLDFLGVIGPHADLATLLGRRLGIARTVSHLIPGESRLGRPQEAADRGTHFPAVFDRIMAEIEVPHEGAVFLVAGGLLGKLYCDRIKRLGGIALDIGAMADAWMGHNTRGIVLDVSMRHRLTAG